MLNFIDEKLWQEKYNIWKGSDWPECPPIDKIETLPDWVKRELIKTFECTLLQSQRKVFKTALNNFSIYYREENDGGGTTFGQEYLEVIKTKYSNRKFNWCYEWCSGPGFIGYSILEHNLCENLFMTDIWEPAINDAEYTKNNLDHKFQDKIIIHLLKDISLIPKNYKFDFIVGNPPHYKNYLNIDFTANRICTDLNWESHNNFYKNIKKNLSDDGIILLQESSLGSTKHDFLSVIEENQLTVTDCFTFNIKEIYYLEVKHSKGDTAQ